MDNNLYYKPEKKGPKPVRVIIAIVLSAVILISGYEIYKVYKINYIDTNSNTNENSDIIISNENTNAVNVNTNTTSTTPKTVATIPEKASLKVPFTTQAPLANWDALHEEACEEASLIMYHHFVNGSDITSTTSAEKEIQDLVAFEGQNGYAVDVTMAQLNEIAIKYYGMKTGRVIKNATINDIKREVASGRPVIIPAAGKMLDNPNFKNGGPKYHNLVVKGYDKDGWITNDPGTRKGEYFRYTFDNLYNAIHDWDEGDITNGAKNVLVFD